MNAYRWGNIWILAIERDDGRFEAPMHKAGKRLTGCQAVYGSLRDCATSCNITAYMSKASALRALKRIEGT